MDSSKSTVLVVDDSLVSRTVLEKILTGLGYEVVLAEGGREALALLDEISPDLILLDVEMPDMDGFSVCGRLKAETRLGEIPVIFITGRTDSDDLVRGFEAGAVDYVSKPFHGAEVAARARTHVCLFLALKELRRLQRLALDANPLTGLPGNNSIESVVQGAIDEDREQTVVYCDLDNFKAFNDWYGFSRGDEVIRFTAGVLREVCPRGGFLGHVGGDDFVLVVPSGKAKEVAAQVAARFDSGVLDFYAPEDRERGFIVAPTRTGEIRRYPIASISMAGVPLQGRGFDRFVEVASVCAEVKKVAKAVPGSVFKIDRRQGSRRHGQGSVEQPALPLAG